MQPPEQSSPKFPPSIFEAIKNDDWEGLIAKYAVTVYDAIHSPDDSGRMRRNTSSRRGGGHQPPSPSSLMAAVMDAGRPKQGNSFRDGKSDFSSNSKQILHRYLYLYLINPLHFLCTYHIMMFVFSCRESTRRCLQI